jgi:hypothetical protein
MSFWFIACDPRSLFLITLAFAPGNEVDEYHDNGNHQQDVNEPAHRVTAHQTKQPQDEQYYRNCV